MKKSYIALAALALVSGVASAQSSVTIYGKVDLGGVFDSGAAAGKSVRLTSGVTGGSRLGFKGIEDLGGGYKAGFTLETGFCADSAAPVNSTLTVKNGAGATVGTTTQSVPNFCTGSNAFMGRQAHGDLSGSFGSLIAGRQFSLGYANLLVLDPFGVGYAGQIVNIVDPSGTRLNNSVRYTTPSIAGFTASGEIALGETTGNWQASRETGGAITYASGPAYATFMFYDLDNTNGNGAARKNYQLGGTYDFGVVKIHAMAQKSTGSPTGAAKPLDVLDLMGGVTVPFAGGNVLASYIHHNDRTSGTAFSTGDEDASQWGIGYNYPLSKRTAIYTAYARINNDNNQSGKNAGFTVGNSTETGTGNKSFNLGVVHNF
jgi:predicted porin